MLALSCLTRAPRSASCSCSGVLRSSASYLLWQRSSHMRPKPKEEGKPAKIILHPCCHPLESAVMGWNSKGILESRLQSCRCHPEVKTRTEFGVLQKCGLRSMFVQSRTLHETTPFSMCCKLGVCVCVCAVSSGRRPVDRHCPIPPVCRFQPFGSELYLKELANGIR